MSKELNIKASWIEGGLQVFADSFVTLHNDLSGLEKKDISCLRVRWQAHVLVVRTRRSVSLKLYHSTCWRTGNMRSSANTQD